MHLNPTFATLLAGVLFTVSTQTVQAFPTPNNGLITLPLRRHEQRSDVHPAIRLQQHINHGRRRLARMKKREISEHTLRADLERRLASIGDDTPIKRFNRYGVPKTLLPREVSFRKKGKGGAFGGGAFGGVGSAGASGAAGAGAAGAGAAGAGAGAAGAGAGAGSGSSGAANATPTGIIAGAPAVDPNTVTDSNTPTDGNSLALDIEGNDVSYLATVQIGTPPQNYLILMDSGSADFWVGADDCQSQEGGNCGQHQFLGTQESSTFQASTNQFQVTYGTGEVQGTIIQDNVAIAGLQLNAHTFGVADVESDDFTGAPFDGLMGLAQSTLSEQKTLTPVESLAQQGLITEAITSYKIPRLADNLKDGEITFGGLDPSKFNAQTLVTIPNVNTEGFWEGAVDAFTVNGQDSGLQGRTAILDTGTTLIVAPPSDAAAIHQLIPGAASDGQGGFTVPCDTNASVALTFGGHSFAIEPTDVAFQQVDGNTCSSGITAGEIGGATEWLVGDVFLKNAYFSTDVGKNTVSLAELS